MCSAIAICNISKRYGAVAALRGLTATIELGDKTLLLGPNGSGKSTLLKVVAGLTLPDHGEIKIFDGRRDPLQIGYIGHELQLYGPLTVGENLALERELIGQPKAEIEEQIERWDLGTYIHRPIQTLSRGTRVRAALARAFLRRPKILLFDEPTSGLDESSAELLARTIEEHVGTVVVVTHDLFRLKRIATRLIVLRAGGIVSDSSIVGMDATYQRYYECNA